MKQKINKKRLDSESALVKKKLSDFIKALPISFQGDRVFPYTVESQNDDGTPVLRYIEGFPKDVCWLISLMNLAKKECRFAMARHFIENEKDFRYTKVYHENRIAKLCGKRIYLLDVFSDYFKTGFFDDNKRAIEIIRTLSVVKGNSDSSLTPYLLGVINKNDVLHRINMWIYTEGYIIFDDSSFHQREVIRYVDLEGYISSKYKKIVSITAVMDIDTDEQASCHEDGTLK